jgi:hypothetical protein
MTVHDYKTLHRPSLWKSEEQELCFSTSSRNHVFRVRAFFQPILRLEKPEDRTAWNVNGSVTTLGGFSIQYMPNARYDTQQNFSH